MVATRPNPFPQPSPLERALLVELCKCARACYDRGWSHGQAGNFSVRARDGLVWQSPAAVQKGELTPERFVPVSLATARPVGPLPARPSNETAVHLGIYRAVPRAKVIVHTHAPSVVVASRAGADLVFQGDEMQKHLGCRDHRDPLTIPVAPNPAPDALGAFVSEAARYVRADVPLLVLAGHGVYAWGATPADALVSVEALEFLCRTAP